jgi:nitroreductase
MPIATSSPVREAALRRRSRSKVTDVAPTHDELLEFVAAAATVADHSGLQPWRLIELRGDSREIVGRSIAKAEGADRDGADKLARKSLRAPLLIAVVVSPKESRKVPGWEQESVASGVAHLLSLLLDEAGWGVMWRTGTSTRATAVHKAHGLKGDEKLLGWLYVGQAEERTPKARKPVDASRFVSSL